MGIGAAQRHVLATAGAGVTQAATVFGAHPYNGSNELGGGLCDTLTRKA